MTTKLRIGYVPEHFAAPLLQLAETEWGRAHLEIVSQPSGTGQMLTSLDPASQKIDVAVALTEALIAGIAKGRTDYKLVGSYVRTSLNWAVITGTDAKADAYQSISDLRGTRIGISRIGSGSQLMASVMALQHGWTDNDGGVEPIEFVVNDTFANLRSGVNQVAPHATSCFMWEWFTTKPFADSGEVRFIGSVPTPWPSWTIAASTSVDDALLSTFLTRLHEAIQAFANPDTRASGAAADWIVNHHGYQRADVLAWLDTVRWSGEQTPNPATSCIHHGQNATTCTVSKDVLTNTLDVLDKAGVVHPPPQGWDLASFVPAQRLVD